MRRSPSDLQPSLRRSLDHFEWKEPRLAVRGSTRRWSSTLLQLAIGWWS